MAGAGLLTVGERICTRAAFEVEIAAWIFASKLLRSSPLEGEGTPAMAGTVDARLVDTLTGAVLVREYKKQTPPTPQTDKW